MEEYTTEELCHELMSRTRVNAYKKSAKIKEVVANKEKEQLYYLSADCSRLAIGEACSLLIYTESLYEALTTDLDVGEKIESCVRDRYDGLKMLCSAYDRYYRFQRMSIYLSRSGELIEEGYRERMTQLAKEGIKLSLEQVKYLECNTRAFESPDNEVLPQRGQYVMKNVESTYNKTNDE